MSCYNPLGVYLGKVGVNGKRSIGFSPRDNARGKETLLPCGNCIGCRLDRSRDWSIRCMHEAQMHDENCFLTLTYSEPPENGSVSVEEFKLFMKRLRKYAGEKKIKFFHCGEYGAKLSRPHYHALIFGLDFADKYVWSVRNGNSLYRSKDLEGLWTKGFSTIGEVNAKTSAYVARYIMKKLNGDMAESHYGLKNPEYITMSRKEGIGKTYFEKYMNDIYPDDFVIVDGVKAGVPAYYDKLLEKKDKKLFEEVKARRVKLGYKLSVDNDSFRRSVKEYCKKSAVKSLVRSLEV